MKIVFRTNAGKNIGLGHLNRCLSIASGFTYYYPNLHLNIFFIVNKEGEAFCESYKTISSEKFDDYDISIIKSLDPDIVFFDSYLATNHYLKLMIKNFFLVLLDDNNLYKKINPRVLINGNIYANRKFYPKYHESTLYLLGPEYLPMKREYWTSFSHDQQIIKPLNKDIFITITSGAADFYRILPKFQKYLKNLDLPINYIIGPAFTDDIVEELSKKKKKNECLIHAPESLKEIILSSAIIISAAGSTVYEVLALNKPIIIFTIAENQEDCALLLKNHNVLFLGNQKQIKWEDLESVVSNLYLNLASYHSKIEHLYSNFDGNGVYRICKCILKKFKDY
ncbi:glycosyltransferase [Promethearchaeum syntrophicum]|uniref:Glycosyltransferase n=1 Tax=Promethearchaeum syntrophicum TaxID=2594042 RepID=A0A5B9DAN0_9ARCH|nr:glycosyltransferase [Candidatus Prometheoarchaeum syntrophicum]QEE16025.1 hypothetical protein DSAG12_01853 [Candidatus Prometheoarchaeum syntrophicum]